MRMVIMVVGSLLAISMLMEGVRHESIATPLRYGTWSDLMIGLAFITVVGSLIVLALPRIAALLFAGVDASSVWLVWDADSVALATEAYAWPVVAFALALASVFTRPPALSRNYPVD